MTKSGLLQHAVQLAQGIFQTGNGIAVTGAKPQFPFHAVPYAGLGISCLERAGCQRRQQDDGIPPCGRNADEQGVWIHFFRQQHSVFSDMYDDGHPPCAAETPDVSVKAGMFRIGHTACFIPERTFGLKEFESAFKMEGKQRTHTDKKYQHQGQTHPCGPHVRTGDFFRFFIASGKEEHGGSDKYVYQPAQ